MKLHPVFQRINKPLLAITTFSLSLSIATEDWTQAIWIATCIGQLVLESILRLQIKVHENGLQEIKKALGMK